MQTLLESEANELLNTNGSNVYLIFEALGQSSYEKPHSIVSTFVSKAMHQATQQPHNNVEREQSSSAVPSPEEEPRLGLSLATVTQNELTDMILEYLNKLEKQREAERRR